MKEQGYYFCVVETVIAEHGGGCIFKARLDDERIVNVLIPYKLRGKIKIGKGQHYKIQGIERVHATYGVQIAVSSFFATSPHTTKNIQRFVAHAPEMRGIGIGKKKAKALADSLGSDLFDLLNSGNSKALVERAEGILTEYTAEALCERWSSHRGLGLTAEFLDEHGITGNIASLMMTIYGERTEKALREDPYRLVAFRTPRYSAWLEIKDVARKLGFSSGDDRELIGAVEFIIYKQHSQGDTAVTYQFLRDEVARLVGGRRKAEEAVDLALDKRLVVWHRGLIQHIGARSLEETIERNFGARVGAGNAENPEWVLGTVIPNAVTEDEVERELDRWEVKNFALNVEQRKAVVRCFTRKLSVIAGGAGVGKTSVLRVVADLASDHGREVHCLALAGRAAKRITEASGNEAKTIAGFVNAVRSGKVKPQAGDIVIVDEASMISLPEIIRILRGAGNAGIVFVGDEYQLPPISFGEVFPHLVESSSVSVTRLRRIYRQGERTGIPIASNMVRGQRLPTFVPYQGSGDGINFIPCVPNDIEGKVYEVYSTLGKDDECQVICMTNSGLAGTKRVNKLIQARLSTDNDQLVRYGIMAGDPVIYLKNDYERGLYNGSLGNVKNINMESNTIEVVWDDGLVTDVPLTELHINLEVAYGITCHKAQGSQFSKVIIPIRQARNLDGRMLYTAITRAKTQIVLVGDYDAFSRAIRTAPDVLRRRVGFSADYGPGGARGSVG